MSKTVCGYGATRDEVLVAYLYGDIAEDERVAFARHLNGCPACRSELTALGAVRTELQRWAPPDTGALVGGRQTPAIGPVNGRSGWRDIPVWAQVAAAMLFMGIAAGVANLDMTYSREGFTVRTGWLPHAGTSPAAVPASGVADTSFSPLATQAELAALAQQLRAELGPRASTAAAAVATLSRPGEEEIVRRVRALIRDSEQRQQRELALRIAEVAQDAQAQRQADLLRIDRTLGALQSTTGTAVRRQEQLLNNLAVRVSQRRQ
jgi:hypothetical protein